MVLNKGRDDTLRGTSYLIAYASYVLSIFHQLLYAKYLSSLATYIWSSH